MPLRRRRDLLTGKPFGACFTDPDNGIGRIAAGLALIGLRRGF